MGMLRSIMILAVFAAVAACHPGPQLGNPQSATDYDHMSDDQLASAALRGSVEAEYLFASRKCCGVGPQYDHKIAYRLMCDSAKKNYADAQYAMGAFFESGIPMQFTGKNQSPFLVPADTAQAYMWYSVAAEQQHQPASEAKQRMEATMTAQQLNEAFRLLKSWKSTNCDRVG